MIFHMHIGIDYSGQKAPSSRAAALQVYASTGGSEPQRIRSPYIPDGADWNWCRKEIAHWIIDQAESGENFIAGIDHGFSFPSSYFTRYGLRNWEHFLEDFCRHWPTDEEHMCVDFVREQKLQRTGSANELRLTEQWSSSAKSVFKFDVQGSVAKSTHAGIPWLRHIKHAVGDRIHLWPFDGWDVPEKKSVIVEVYPSLVRNRYPNEEQARTSDQHDAYAVAHWLSDMDQHGFLQRYFDPPLTKEQRRIAGVEGWIFGVS